MCVYNAPQCVSVSAREGGNRGSSSFPGEYKNQRLVTGKNVHRKRRFPSKGDEETGFWKGVACVAT